MIVGVSDVREEVRVSVARLELVVAHAVAGVVVRGCRNGNCVARRGSMGSASRLSFFWVGGIGFC